VCSHESFCVSTTLHLHVSTIRYALLAFEFTIVVLSAVALKKGVRKVKGKLEVVMYSVCFAVGIFAFVTFYVLCYRLNKNGYNSQAQSQASSPSQNHLNANDDLDDDLAEYTLAAEEGFAKSDNDYYWLVRLMLIVWVALAGVTLLAWAYVQLVRGTQTQLPTFAYTHARTHVLANVCILTRTSHRSTAATTTGRYCNHHYNHHHHPLHLFELNKN
jgi:hypothetical protein